MNKIKIEAKKLKEFVSIASLNGEFEKLVIVVKPEGFFVGAMNSLQDKFSKVLLKKEAFIEYDLEVENESIGIRDSSLLLSLLDSFGSEKIILEYDVTTSMNLYSERKSITINLINSKFNPEIVIPEVGYELFKKFENNIKLNTSVLKEAFKDVKLLGMNSLEIKVSNNVMELISKNKNDSIKTSVPCVYEDFTAEYSIGLEIMLNVSPSEIQFSNLGGENSPSKLSFNSENIDAELIIAPLN